MTVAELWFGEATWGQVEMYGVRQDEVGEARVTGVQFRVSLYPPPPAASQAWWRFDLADVRAQLDAAEGWLLENEKGRVPLDRDGLTAAGQALTKKAEDRLGRHKRTEK